VFSKQLNGKIATLATYVVMLTLPVLCSTSFADTASGDKPMLLKTTLLKGYVDRFNTDDTEYYKNTYPNKDAYTFLEANIPLFECPDKAIEKIYYFRWWTYRKHIRKTEDGFVVTEFLPSVGHASSHNVISCAAGHHFREGRWLHNAQIVRDYMNFYLTKPDKSGSHRYSWWSADSILAITAVHPDDHWLTTMLDPLIRQYQGWSGFRVRSGELYVLPAGRSSSRKCCRCGPTSTVTCMAMPWP